MTRTVAPGGRTSFSWQSAFALARYELLVSARTVIFWALPTLWVLLLILQIQGRGLRVGLQSLGGAGYIPGFFAAALAVTLPARTRAAGASDIVGAMPAGRAAAVGRMLAAMAGATVLILVAPLGGTMFALATGAPTAGSAGPLGMFVALLLPVAWVGAGLGLLAGRAIPDTRLAMLAVFLGGGLGLVVARAGPLVLWPFGAFDLASAPWPFGGLLPWHLLTLVGVAGLVGAAAAHGGERNGFGRSLALGASGFVLVGCIGYQLALVPIQVGPGRRAAAPPLPWTVQQMDVTLAVGGGATGTAAMVLRNAGSAPLTEVPLHMPAGLHVASAHLVDGGSLAPGPVLRLPSAVAAGATVDLAVTYGGRWTAFANRTATSLVRAVGPNHVVLQAAPAMGWAPHPEVGGSYHLTLHLTGQVPAETFCNLSPTAPLTWSGKAGNVQCIGANLRETQAGTLVVWTQRPQTVAFNLQFSVSRVLSEASSCLGVSGAVAGVIAIPPTSTGWIREFVFRRYGDPALVAPVPSPVGFNLGFLGPEDGVQPAWGPGGTATVAGDPSLRQALISLLQEVVDREEGWPVSGNSAFIRSSPGGREVEAAMAHLSTAGDCRLLGTLHAMDVSGELTDAALAQAVAAVKGGSA